MRELIYLRKIKQPATPQQAITEPAIGKAFNNKFWRTKPSLKPTPVTVAFISLFHLRSQLNKIYYMSKTDQDVCQKCTFLKKISKWSVTH